MSEQKTELRTSLSVEANGNSSSAHFQHEQPKLGRRARETQDFGEIMKRLRIGLSDEVRAHSVAELNQILADSMMLRDLYKKHHWQAAGITFREMHLLFDKHYEDQVALVDAIAERIQILGGISVAVPQDIAEMTQIVRPAKGREEISVQLSRLLEAHETILITAREAAARAAAGTICRRKRRASSSGAIVDDDGY